ncbi:hypothetical protein FQZ97_1146020 [compost metagenome]
MASSRARASERSRFGSSNQLRSARLPMPVWQTSSSENSVGLVSPRRVWVSSRLRRVVVGKSINSSLRATRRLFTWLSARPWVCSA